ncbi:hypothetical protein [Geoalkalibacter halelectricus]|uniref:Carboxypeptidase regulatory-like domain-containing protein n=1 Tax=Geoalkalibacter halelectricus TaxID=2847045 RepID=A0ABY5ZID8_9BACT|nr:hypothetical protein [Geoalkalibacter halelectricus]MDO3379029.1 hypothetical protein [Geoalkalibacter halelectricus]UWZ78843.1 hypothetical protein L9S41_14310 [Geoalkalibacter halelectricus]
MRNPIFILCLTLLLWCGSSAAAEVLVSGKVAGPSREGEAGIRVGAWPVDSLSLEGEPPHLSAPTGVDGEFELSLPAPGDYFLIARGGGWFCFYGRNPVRVPPEGLHGVNLGLVPETTAAFTAQVDLDEGVIGQVLADGTPVADALVYVYLDPNSRFKGMGYAILGPTDADGLFAMELPPGRYYFLVRKRRQAAAVGPLQAGDHFGYWHGNPLQIQPGEVQRLAVSLQELPQRVEDLQSSLFGRNSIAGQVRDREGQPVAGMRVLLYDDPQMLNRPLFVSRPTDAEGRYQLSFPDEGRFYVGARSTLGGAPEPDEFIGTYAGSADGSIRVEAGEQLQDIDIVVGEMW